MVNGYKPATLREAVEIRARENVIPYAGGTDLMVQNKKDAPYLFLNDIDELRQLKDDGEYIRIGAAVTFTEAIASPVVPQLMKEAVSRIAAPAIRNAGTFGGNLGNASDKADSVLVEFAADGLVRLVSASGERVIPVEEFSIKRGVTSIKDDELIAEILLPKSRCEMPFYYKKVGGRNALAISHIAIAGLYDISGGIIRHISVAFIADAGVFLRFKDIETELENITTESARSKTDGIIKKYADRINLTNGRVTAEYRKTVALNLLRDFLNTVSE